MPQALAFYIEVFNPSGIDFCVYGMRQQFSVIYLYIGNLLFQCTLLASSPVLVEFAQRQSLIWEVTAGSKSEGVRRATIIVATWKTGFKSIRTCQDVNRMSSRIIHLRDGKQDNLSAISLSSRLGPVPSGVKPTLLHCPLVQT